jgi:hypothetical protein
MMWSEGGQVDRLGFAGMRGGGKGGAQQQSTTDTSVHLPAWLDEASQQAVGMAQDLSQRPYTPYTGQIVAQPGADTTQAYQQVRDLQGQAQPAFDASQAAYQGMLGQVAPITAQGLNQGTNQLFGNYQQNVMNPAQGLLGGFASQGPATAQGVASNAQQLMNPYTQNVIDPALAAGQQQLALANQGIAGQAANVGAFGGSRQGVAEGNAAAQTALGTQQQIGNMLTQGWGQATGQGLSLAQQAAQQGLSSSQFLAGLGQQGYNAAASQAGNMANTNLQAGLTSAQQLPGVALQQQGEAQKEASMMQTIGAAQQQQQQQNLNAQMGQFYEQQGWPVQNLDVLLSAVGGVPYGTSSTGVSTAPKQTKNLAGGVLGGAASGAAMGTAIAPGYGTAVGAVAGGILGAL